MGDRVNAIKFYNQAIATINDKSIPNNAGLSYQLFGSSIISDPKFADGWMHLGNANSDMGFTPASAACFRRLLELVDGDDPGDITPDLRAKALTNLGHRLHAIGQNKEARERTMESIAMDPSLAYAWCNLSRVDLIDNKYKDAVEHAKKAFDLDQSAVIEMALAFAQMFSGEYGDGLKHFERRFEYKLHQYLQYPYPKWDGVPDKELFLVADQGLGDTLSFARFVRLAAARSKFVRIGVQQELYRLLSAAFGYLKNVSVTPLPCPFPPADYWTTFVSLPAHMGLSTEQIKNEPNVILPKFNVSKEWKSIDRDFHIGVAWAGSPDNDIDRHRSFPVIELLELYKVPGIQLYSLQVGPKKQDMYNAGMAVLLRDLSPYITDVCDTMAIIDELDLVITVESAVAHMAGAIGKECWVPSSYLGRDWRLDNATGSILWNPKHRVFRQGAGEQWSVVFERIREALQCEIGEK